MRKHCRRRVWSTSINPVAHAIAGACIADTASLNELRKNELKSLEAMKSGEAGVQEWQILVDMMNIAEMMGRNGIGPEVLDHCEIATEALHRAAKRYEATKKMGLSGEGLRALGDIMEYHDLQRTSISRSKYEKMIQKTTNYLKSHGKNVTHIKQDMTTLQSQVQMDEITSECAKAFDFEFDGKSTFDVPSLNAPDDFSIGLIVGPSGSGKSTLLKQFGLDSSVEWAHDKSICSHFQSSDDAIARLGAVGLNSVPVWVKPYHVLSTGEKFRADLARRLDNGAVIDEFTSVVDRNVAKSCSYAISRHIRKEGLKNIVFATCHYDIVEWLQPDWVFDTTVGVLSTRGVERRPIIKLELIPSTVGAWALFSKHHYLTGNINRSARCWVVEWEGTAIGFAAVIPLPSGTLKGAWRGHRTVVLPEFQGLGLGVRISDAMGTMILAEGGRYFSKSSSSRLGEYRNSSKLWKPTSKNQKIRGDSKSEKKWTNQNYRMAHAQRMCYSHEFIGKQE